MSLLKRTSSLKKEQHNMKEKHNKNDVLCFENFMINIVRFGKKEDDYQSSSSCFNYGIIKYTLIRPNIKEICNIRILTIHSDKLTQSYIVCLIKK